MVFDDDHTLVRLIDFAAAALGPRLWDSASVSRRLAATPLLQIRPDVAF